jgi:outer membrane protein TolC
LIKQALKRNPNLAAADATLRAAQENANAAFGSLLFPSVGLGGSATRQQINPSSFGQAVGSPSIYNVYNTSVSVNYNLDVFGGARRAVQSAQAQAEISGFQLEGAYLNLTANIVTTAIREAALRAQYASNLEIYEAQKNLADIIAKQLEIGTASRVDLTSQI